MNKPLILARLYNLFILSVIVLSIFFIGVSILARLKVEDTGETIILRALSPVNPQGFFIMLGFLTLFALFIYAFSKTKGGGFNGDKRASA